MAVIRICELDARLTPLNIRSEIIMIIIIIITIIMPASGFKGNSYVGYL
jgi:hypothetical protein